ncbi:MAG: RimK-like ATPgrasp N-terminal domain-containing protein [Melioribacteraceae bacterium]|nr:RimK-like ATPgrasp N-terminal domain-containing protein [Melioribacteraceae bacterium]
MRSFVVVNNPRDWNFNIDNVEVISAKSYLTESNFAEIKSARVFNLCRSYRYQATGYYVSLLAEARGHRSFPNVSTIQDIKTQSIVRIISDDLEELIQKSLVKIKSKEFVLSIYFGQNMAHQYDKLTSQLYNLFSGSVTKSKFYF